MKDEKYGVVQWQGHRWILSPPFSTPAFQGLLSSLSQGVVVKENKVRTVYRLSWKGEDFYLKKYHYFKFWQKLLPGLGITSSKARHEWALMDFLYRSGFPTAQPLAYGEKKRGGILRSGYFLTRGLPGEELSTYLPKHREELSSLAGLLAGLLHRLHQRGIYHPDCHINNVLVNGENRGFLIDFHSARRLPYLPLYLRRRALIKLCHSLVFEGQQALIRPLLDKVYSLDPHLSRNRENLHELVDRGVKKKEVLRLGSRTRRVWKNSSEFQPEKTSQGRLYRRRTRSVQWIESQIKEVQDAPPPAKSETPAVRVEKYPPRPWWQSQTPARRIWVGARALSVRSIPGPLVFAYCDFNSGEYILIEKRSQAVKVMDFATTWEKKKIAAPLVGTLVGRLHRHSLFFKASLARSLYFNPSEEEVYLDHLEGLYQREATEAEVRAQLEDIRENLFARGRGESRLFGENYCAEVSSERALRAFHKVFGDKE